jgi:predicted dehydrogenase
MVQNSGARESKDGEPRASRDRRTFLAQTAGALVGVALLPDLIDAAPRFTGRARKVGLIGAGRQGRAILAELQKLDMVEVAAVSDIVAARVEAGRERAPDAEGFTDHAELLSKRSDVEALFVATPTHLHRQIVEDCLRAGRHVYVEAPIAATVEDARAIADAAAAASGVVVQAGFLGRSNPIYKLARGFFRSDAVRDPVALYAQTQRKTSWRFPAADGATSEAANWRLNADVSIGLAGELGSHQIDVARWFLGRDPVRVSGRGAIRLHDDGRTLPDTIWFDLVWEDGVPLRYQASLATSYGGQYEVLHGTNATLRLAWTHGWMFKEADAPTQGWEVYATRQQFHGDEGIVLVADATKLAAQGALKEGGGLPQPSLYYGIGDFVRSVLHGAPVVCSAEEGARSTVIGILANQAILTGQPLDLTW